MVKTTFNCFQFGCWHVLFLLFQFRNQYDNDVSTWSPQGRIHQVEYAVEAVKQGSAAIGLRSKKYAILLALKVHIKLLEMHFLHFSLAFFWWTCLLPEKVDKDWWPHGHRYCWIDFWCSCIEVNTFFFFEDESLTYWTVTICVQKLWGQRCYMIDLYPFKELSMLLRTVSWNDSQVKATSHLFLFV